MADPGTTPPVPTNPFSGGGVENNVDRQKALLNDLIAMQGQAGRQVYARQGADAQGLLQQRLSEAGPVPAARQAVYDAFSRDAQAAAQQNARTMQRQAQLGNIFMDQAKAAVPIYAKDVDATTEAMRLQFEERRRREEEQAAAQRAALARSSGGSSYKSVEQRIAEGEEDRAVKRGTALSILEKSGVPRSQWSTSDVVAAGLSGGKLSFDDAASALGIPSDMKKTMAANKDAQSIAQQTIDELYNGDKDVNFEQVQSTVAALVEAGVVSEAMANVMLLVNSPRWGLSAQDAFGLGISSDRTRGSYR